jgi:hypothetical protein
MLKREIRALVERERETVLPEVVQLIDSTQLQEKVGGETALYRWPEPTLFPTTP